MLDRLKLLLGIKDNSKDELLEELITLCSTPICNYIREDKVPPQLSTCLMEFVIVRYNKLNSEGFSSENIDGASISYIENYFDIIRTQLDDYIESRDNKSVKRIKFI